jgi:hypothetical protein
MQLSRLAHCVFQAMIRLVAVSRLDHRPHMTKIPAMANLYPEWVRARVVSQCLQMRKAEPSSGRRPCITEMARKADSASDQQPVLPPVKTGLLGETVNYWTEEPEAAEVCSRDLLTASCVDSALARSASRRAGRSVRPAQDASRAACQAACRASSRRASSQGAASGVPSTVPS